MIIFQRELQNTNKQFCYFVLDIFDLTFHSKLLITALCGHFWTLPTCRSLKSVLLDQKFWKLVTRRFKVFHRCMPNLVTFDIFFISYFSGTSRDASRLRKNRPRRNRVKYANARTCIKQQYLFLSLYLMIYFDWGQCYSSIQLSWGHAKFWGGRMW